MSSSPWPESYRNRNLQRIASFLLFGLTVFYFIQALRKGFRMPWGNDLEGYLLAARAMFNRADPYNTDATSLYLYPPLLAFVFLAFLSIPKWLFHSAWFALNLWALVYALRIFVEEYGEFAFDENLWFPALLFSIIFFPAIQGHFLNGQIDAIMLLWMVLFFRDSQRSKPALAALWLSLAISIKVIPAVFLAYLFVRKRYRTMVLTVVFTVFFFLLPGLWVGRKVFFYIHQFHAMAVSVTDSYVRSAFYFYFNIPALVFKLFPSAEPKGLIITVCQVVVMGCFVAIDYFSRRRNLKNQDAWMFSLYLVAMLLISPMSEKHHLVFLIPAAIIAFHALFTDGAFKTARQAMFGVFILLNLSVYKFFDRKSEHPFFLIGLLIVLGLALVEGFRERRSLAGPSR